MQKRVPLLAALIFLLVSGVFLLMRPQQDTNPSSPSPSKPVEQVTIQGKITCLPHKDTNGPQTLECAYGLKDNQGNHYGLQASKTQSIMSLPMNTDVTISGRLHHTTDSKYATKGTIEIQSVKEGN